ncbi:hypothetical protein ACFO5O_01240 [Geojedonia litorea]|uniref:Immunity protein 17 n=1 Tax=Geojedonia litorea TaxID=1268269 RepID=A0ABV9N0H1_9FLAO
MSKQWIIILAALIFLIALFLFWKLTSAYAKKGYGSKMWKHWPTQLAYWQAAVLYSIGFTTMILFILKWADVLTY